MHMCCQVHTRKCAHTHTQILTHDYTHARTHALTYTHQTHAPEHSEALLVPCSCSYHRPWATVRASTGLASSRPHWMRHCATWCWTFQAAPTVGESFGVHSPAVPGAHFASRWVWLRLVVQCHTVLELSGFVHSCSRAHQVVLPWASETCILMPPLQQASWLRSANSAHCLQQACWLSGLWVGTTQLWCSSLKSFCPPLPMPSWANARAQVPSPVHTHHTLCAYKHTTCTHARTRAHARKSHTLTRKLTNYTPEQIDARKHTRARVCTHIYTWTHANAHAHAAHTHTYTHTRTNTHTHTCTPHHKQTRATTHTNTNTHTLTRACTHAHTQTHAKHDYTVLAMQHGHWLCLTRDSSPALWTEPCATCNIHTFLCCSSPSAPPPPCLWLPLLCHANLTCLVHSV